MAITTSYDEQNPIVVTISGAHGTSARISGIGNYKITRLHWLTPTTQGHKCAIQDGTGKDIHEFYCDNDNE